MAELKTRRNDGDVGSFIASIDDDGQRGDAAILVELMGRVTGSPAQMWGTSIVGFGSYHYRYASGREGDWFVVGLSPRTRTMTIYLMDGIVEYESLLARLGKHSTGKACLYVKRLDDIDLDVLEEIIRRSVTAVRESDVAESST